MDYYPVNLDVRNRHCLVVGGGAVGTRKALTLIKCGADVTVVGPEADAELLELEKAGEVRLKKKKYESSDLKGAFLVFVATDDARLNQNIHADARQQNVLCNIADCPEKCDFILPSVISRGDLTITVSTAGKSPALSRKLRIELEQQFGLEYEVFLHLMGKIRQCLLVQDHDNQAHGRLFRRLVESDLIDEIRKGQTDQIDTRLKEILGESYSFDKLMQMDI